MKLFMESKYMIIWIINNSNYYLIRIQLVIKDNLNILTLKYIFFYLKHSSID